MSTSDYLFADGNFTFAYMPPRYTDCSMCKVGSLQFLWILFWRVATHTPQGSSVLHLGFFIPSAAFADDSAARLPVVPFGRSMSMRQYSLYVTTRQIVLLEIKQQRLRAQITPYPGC